MDKALAHLRNDLNDKLARFLAACSDSQVSVNLNKVTKAMQPHFRKFESMVINLSDSYWQPIITIALAESLHSLNFQTTTTISSIPTSPTTTTSPSVTTTPIPSIITNVGTERLGIPREDTPQESMEEVEEESHDDDDSLPDVGSSVVPELLNRTSVSQVGVSEGSDDDAKYQTFGNTTDPDDITQIIDERKESEYMASEPVAEEMEESDHSPQLDDDHKAYDDEIDGDDRDGIADIHPDIWTQIEREVANQQHRESTPETRNGSHGFGSSTTFMIPDHEAPHLLGDLAASPPPPPLPSHSSSTSESRWVNMNVRWKANSNFTVRPGITSTQIVKGGSTYSSIYSLEPMMARIFRYTFLLSDVQERGKPWIGIGIISSKCPYLQSGRWPPWHACNKLVHLLPKYH